ncbi:MAG: hypothetical protein A2Y57_02435 [Candidatus Woykebacteria bacterium RBG_13_40_7b]|uniref:Uncharacterized protein n=1 Tax=Candidatus Woykebacteria bacterium RBG_13_40_7b TaxID=1802594 RepID=A0A1G1WCH7_9BACT|nr:MAG: hypothetical protein A2Y57_02435 [Candidatus Woykebacteria bacterium RBG_13_40_7b]
MSKIDWTARARFKGWSRANPENAEDLVRAYLEVRYREFLNQHGREPQHGELEEPTDPVVDDQKFLEWVLSHEDEYWP